MARKTRLAITVISLLLCSAILMILPIGSQEIGKYDPWADIDDNGIVDILDAIRLANAYGTTGDPGNKTELLYNTSKTLTDLLSKIDALNSTLQLRTSQINNLETQIALMNATINDLDNTATLMNMTMTTMSATIAQLQSLNTVLNSRVNALENNVSLILGRLGALEANSLSAIPSNSTYTYSYDATSDAYNWGDIPYMSVTLAVNKTSNLMILFSTDAYCSVGPSESTYIYIQAVVNSSYVNPAYVILTPCVQVTGFAFLPSHAHDLSQGAYSYVFNVPSVTPGFYTIKMQWQVSYGSSQGTAYAGYRTLTAIALPT